ncbi:MAG: hypothetical protein RR928_16285 [Comamonas sp.]|uniref:hypothetical protein n=1 Tax=Comamonas sp. TaxID=34028 RepID=UPI002FCA27EA
MKNKLTEVLNPHKEIIKEIIFNWIPIFVTAITAIYMFYKAWELNIFIQLKSEDLSTKSLINNYRAFYFIYILAGMFSAASAMWMAAQTLTNKSNRHLISRLNWTIERLAKLENSAKEPEQSLHHSESHWPWGSHHTAALGDLEAAAQRFWTLYDPNDPSTAPTNDMVATWLRDERGVSRDKAAAIASILRADGLRPGPRR